MTERSRDWLDQAVHDLEHARESRAAGRYDWSCFAAQQAAEKAVHGLHLSLGQEIWGHVVRRLLTLLPDDITVTADLLDKARVLDAHYVPTRYPNGHPEGAPFEHFGDLQAQEAIRYADQVVSFCSDTIAIKHRA